MKHYTGDPFDEEIPVQDTILKEIFKADGLKTKDLITRRLLLSRWQGYVLKRVGKELEKAEHDRVGKIYIRRKMIVYGIGVFETDNGRALTRARKREAQFLEEYDPRAYAHMANKTELASWNTERRTQIYLEDSTFEYVSTLADICQLSVDSVARLTVSYSVGALKRFFGANIIGYAQGDISELKAHLKSYSPHTSIGAEDEKCLEWLRDQGAISQEASNVSIKQYRKEIARICKLSDTGARYRFRLHKSLGLVNAKRTGQHTYGVWLND